MSAFDKDLKVKYSKSLTKFDELEQGYLDVRSDLMSLIRIFDNHTQYKKGSELDHAKSELADTIRLLGDLQVIHMYDLLKLKRGL